MPSTWRGRKDVFPPRGYLHHKRLSQLWRLVNHEGSLSCSTDLDAFARTLEKATVTNGEEINMCWVTSLSAVLNLT